jgi:predicted transcriptional regulator
MPNERTRDGRKPLRRGKRQLSQPVKDSQATLRRLAACELRQRGWIIEDIAQALSVHPSTVHTYTAGLRVDLEAGTIDVDEGEPTGTLVAQLRDEIQTRLRDVATADIGDLSTLSTILERLHRIERANPDQAEAGADLFTRINSHLEGLNV